MITLSIGPRVRASMSSLIKVFASFYLGQVVAFKERVSGKRPFFLSSKGDSEWASPRVL